MSRKVIRLSAGAALLLLVPGTVGAGERNACCLPSVHARPTVIYADPVPAVPAPAPLIPVFAPAPVVEVSPPAPIYWVEQGPVYSGPGSTDFPPTVFKDDPPLRDYPYISSAPPAWHGIPHRPRPHRGYVRARG
jgi:hypothetical protein